MRFFFGLAKCGIGHACASDPELADSLHGHDGGSAALLALTQCCCFLHVSRRPRRIEDAECGNARSRDVGGGDRLRRAGEEWNNDMATIFYARATSSRCAASVSPSPALLFFMSNYNCFG